MSDTVKLVIDFPKDKYKDFVACYCGNLNCDWLQKRVAEGIPLDDVKAEIEKLDEGITSYDHDNPWVYKSEVLDILNNIGKAESEEV